MSDDPGHETSDELSARRRTRDELALEAAERNAREEHLLAFTARDFVVCGLPFKRPTELQYRRQNGDTLLEVEGRAAHGLPYGQDRLIPIWLATAFFAAGRPADNVIRFRCCTDILRAFGFNLDGRIVLKRLRERLLRIYHTHFYVTYLRGEKRGRLDRRHYSLIRALNVGMLEDSRRTANQYTLWQDTIRIDDSFADDLRTGGRIPIDLATVRALKESSPALDLYVWQAWRSYRLLAGNKEPTSIPVFGEDGLMAQLGSEATDPRKVRQLLRAWQDSVRQVWQACPNYLNPDCSRFFIFPAAAITVGPTDVPELPGVSPTPPPMRASRSGAGRLILARDDVAVDAAPAG